MIQNWIDNALKFGIDAGKSIPPDCDFVGSELELMATWLTENPTGSHNEYIKEVHGGYISEMD